MLADIKITEGYAILNPHESLSPETIDLFSSVGLRPKMLVLFGRNDTSSAPTNRMIHSDVYMTESGGWEKLVGGVNWELSGSTNTMYWYDMGSTQECWPCEPLKATSKFKLLNGIHYGRRLNMGIPADIPVISQVTITGPTLVRTDKPHATLYHSTEDRPRVAASVRFFEDDYGGSWEQLVDKIAPLCAK